jgi:HEAT repeat protein
VDLPDAEVQRLVQSYLGAIDRPIVDAQWQALGPAAVPHLEAALRSDDLPTRRASAANGLAAIGGARATQALVDRARAEDERYVVRRVALRGAARALPPTKATTALDPVLRGARSASVRAAAADALADSGDATACAAVQAQAAREGAASRSRFAKALARCR